MIGQGSPSSSAIALARIALVFCAFCIVCLATAATAQQPVREPAVRLRIAWGGGESNRWVGRIRMSTGALSDLKLIGTDADAAGSIWLDAGEVQIAALSAHKRDEIQITATGSNAKLLIELAPAVGRVAARAEVLVSDLAQRPYALRLDDSGNMLEVSALPKETLQITTKRNPLIFAVGEQFGFELTPALNSASPGTALDIQTTLSSASPVSAKEIAWSDQQRLAVPVEGPPTVTINVPLHVKEGVYTVHVTATRPSGFQEKFFPGGAAPLAERSFEVVVLEGKTLPPQTAATWESVLEIDPTSPRWGERLPSWTQFRRIPGLNRIPLGSIRAGAVDLPSGRFIELPTTIAGSEPHWQAYSLPLKAVGVPHMLEIDYPAGEEQHFGISIVEPNAAGVVEGIGRDSGVYTEGFGRDAAGQKQTYRLVFWPRTQAPLLLLTNQHPNAAAHFGRIHVLKRNAERLAAAPAENSPNERLVAAYIASPLVPEIFGANGILESSNNFPASVPTSVDDWQTFYESATRLSDYLQYAGYNSAVVSVLADGSAIYPSARLPFTPRYDSGRGTPRLQETDGLELMLRVFDRERLALFPAIEFATPIPELEKLRRASDPQTSGLEWIGPNGQTWLETHATDRGLAPYYNLLDPRVQQSMLSIVRELVDRYGNHPGLAGLAVQLSSNGYAQLPPPEWGFDDVTMQRFQQDTGIAIPDTSVDRFAARHTALTGQHADVWRNWRAKQVAEFYAKVLATVRESGGGQRRLLLTTEQSFDHPQIAARVRPSLLAENRVAAALMDAGLSRELLESMPGLVLCPARLVEPMSPLQDRAIDLEINEAAAAWHAENGSTSTTAALLYHRAERLRLTSFETRSPFKLIGDHGLVCHPLANGAAARKPYIEAIVDNDPAVILDGGDLLPLGQEEILSPLRSVLRQLPAAAEVTQIAKQPIVVRTYAEANRNTILVANLCPWRADASVTLDVTQSTTLQPLLTTTGGSPETAQQPVALAAGRQPWAVSLEPYSIQAVHVVGAKVIDVQVKVADEAKTEINSQLADLAKRDLRASRIYEAISNPSFEPLGGDGPLPGWRLADPAAGTAELDATSPQDGKTCLYFRSNGRLAAVESKDFAIPPTGQLAMTVFVRAQNMDPRAELRLVFETGDGEDVYPRMASVPAAEIVRADNSWGGRPLAIWVNDLPLDSQDKMRIKFELTGPGEVWLDNVKLHDLLFPLQWYGNSQAEILQLFKLIHAGEKYLEDGRLTDSVRLLEGYWPRFMIAYTPLVAPPIAIESAPKQDPAMPPQPDESKESNAGISDRIKRFVPLLR